MKNISILGSTGSIGTQALEIIRNRMEQYKVISISGNLNIDLLYKQATLFRPKYVVVMNYEGYKYLKDKLKIYNIEVLNGMEGLEFISTIPEVDIVLTSVVGMIGIKPTISAIRAGKTIALANKETMVAAGELVINELKESNSKIIPVDSEHSALFQCLNGENINEVRKLLLTASGGPFRGKKRAELQNITPEMALKHPKWNMGRKISIDSATLMNKTLEVIEAHYLFEVEYEKIDVIVHPQSIIHSMVEYVDGSIKAQMSNTSMMHPIQYAFEYPNRSSGSVGYLDLITNNSLTFEKPDVDTFECLNLGYFAGKIGGSMPAVLNAANEEAVELFLNNKIKFLEIGQLVKQAMDNHKTEYNLTLDKIIEIERKTRNYVNTLID
jgi:1-deoxy-D-xylulose-5-phosphate reductoisomerase